MKRETDPWIMRVERHLPPPQVADSIVVAALICALILAFVL